MWSFLFGNKSSKEKENEKKPKKKSVQNNIVVKENPKNINIIGPRISSEYQPFNLPTFYLLKFPQYDRVIISSNEGVRSFKISTGEIEKEIVKEQSDKGYGVKINPYGDSKEQFLLLYKKFNHDNRALENPGYISIISSKTLLELKRTLTRGYYPVNMVLFRNPTSQCFLVSSSWYNLNTINDGKILNLDMSTGEIICKLEGLKMNGSHVFLSKSIQNSFYYNGFSDNFDIKEYPVLLISYNEEEFTIERSFKLEEYMWHIIPFMNSRNQERCICSGAGEYAFIIDPLNESKINRFRLTNRRVSTFEMLGNQYLFSSKEGNIVCRDMKNIDERLQENEIYVPEVLLNFELKGNYGSVSIRRMFLEVDERNGNVDLDILFGCATYKKITINGLQLEGVYGISEKDIIERSDFLKNEEFNDLWCGNQKNKIFVKIKFDNLVFENVSKSFLLL